MQSGPHSRTYRWTGVIARNEYDLGVKFTKLAPKFGGHCPLTGLAPATVGKQRLNRKVCLAVLPKFEPGMDTNSTDEFDTGNFSARAESGLQTSKPGQMV